MGHRDREILTRVGDWVLKAIIWDFDGTIIDTETPQFLAWQSLFAELGSHLEPELWSRVVGTRDQVDLLAELAARGHHSLDRRVLSRRIGQLIYQQLKQAPLRPGVSELMAEAAAQSVAQAIASSSSQAWIAHYVHTQGLDGWIGTIASADDVVAVKPDPEVYRVALGRLGVSAEYCVAIEDSPHGATAALSAGLACVVVPNPSTARLKFPEAVRKFTSLADVRLATLERLIG